MEIRLLLLISAQLPVVEEKTNERSLSRWSCLSRLSRWAYRLNTSYSTAVSLHLKCSGS
ncbi:Protein of unknown function [Lactobacillus helveticus CIRM-BIA 951]|uniref:Uncharacterized protein n=1 Tax=Lactobacillus helveticus CIRM-BIA 951 TaxID=1226334 RepID=U6F2F2_LACHE|nr:Protein of unknown function [Lactobacillus helveticus CIRM-BIA 951]